ncbi:MAG: Activator of Hsp90 ATPase 1 family protein [Flavipsychrobacter sp.]|jgi:uncharacterized protein YndB with AHSA1/START domain|nr:Activator of Hsp90 ATPase 1 family protein [Flavipsychrobacter sp.]
MANTEKVTVQNTVNAPVEKVWTLFTTPADIMNWNSASPDWHTPKAENDLRTGGNFSFTMAAKDGSFSFDFAGVYDEVQNHQVIAYTMGDGRQARTTFEPSGSTTKVTTTFDAESENPVEMQRGGWQAILDNFKNYTEAN